MCESRLLSKYAILYAQITGDFVIVWVERPFQHIVSYIEMGRFKGTGNQYILVVQDSALQTAWHLYATTNFPTYGRFQVSNHQPQRWEVSVHH